MLTVIAVVVVECGYGQNFTGQKLNAKIAIRTKAWKRGGRGGGRERGRGETKKGSYVRVLFYV